ncbi:MAG: hypothetical protein GY759_08700 [Chloroflexi bacterium]|nr:hypothetical protein [Chloroflexota bacterium]
MRDLLLGLDVGTTATKAMLFDTQGDVIASADCSYPLHTPENGWVEQDPDDLWQGVVTTLRSVLEKIGAGDRVIALSLSSQAGTTIPVDAGNQPIYPAISWMDNRASAQAAQVRERWGAETIHHRTGWHLVDGLPLQHITWLRENRPDIFRSARRYLFVNDFIAHKLSGRLCMNPSDAGITQLFNLETVDWDEQLLDIAGIRRGQLSPMHPCGQVIGALQANVSQATGLSPDVLVVNGAHDQYCAAVGTGTTRPGTVLLSCGTAWVVLAVPESLEVGLRSGMSISCHAMPDSWGAIRSLGAVGTSMEWFLQTVWDRQNQDRGADPYGSLNAGAAQSPPGAHGVLFFPLAGGHVAHQLDVGGFNKLSLSHSRDDLARAVMEGVAFELQWAIEEMQNAGIQIDALTMVGGAAESPLWPQIVADITGVPVIVPTVSQAAARGAAILAGVGAGIWPTAEQGYLAFRGDETHLAADPRVHTLYQKLFTQYRSTRQRFM